MLKSKRQTKSLPSINEEIEPYFHTFEHPTFVLIRQVPISTYMQQLLEQCKEALDLDIAYRTLVLEQIIHQSMTRFHLLSEEEKQVQLSGIRLVISPQWLVDHWHNLPIVSNIDITSRLTMLHNSRFTLLGPHYVFIIDKKCTLEQMNLEYQGLCWVEKDLYEHPDPFCIIVHKVSYIKYICMHYGIYFYTMLKEQEEVKDYIHELESRQLIVMSKEFNDIILPNKQQLAQVPSQTFMIAYWRHVDDQLWYYNRSLKVK